MTGRVRIVLFTYSLKFVYIFVSPIIELFDVLSYKLRLRDYLKYAKEINTLSTSAAYIRQVRSKFD